MTCPSTKLNPAHSDSKNSIKLLFLLKIANARKLISAFPINRGHMSWLSSEIVTFPAVINPRFLAVRF